jgi:hypothetical protein
LKPLNPVAPRLTAISFDFPVLMRWIRQSYVL